MTQSHEKLRFSYGLVISFLHCMICLANNLHQLKVRRRRESITIGMEVNVESILIVQFVNHIASSISEQGSEQGSESKATRAKQPMDIDSQISGQALTVSFLGKWPRGRP